MKLNIGCGWEIFPGWVNADCAPLPGVAVLCDFATTPWPFTDNSFSEIRAVNVVEHLPDTMAVLAEMHRVLKPGGLASIRVPHWNSHVAWMDPTHKRTFHPSTFDYFDPRTPIGKKRPYYSGSKFHVTRRGYWVRGGWGLFEKYFLIRSAIGRALLDVLAYPFANVIILLEFELVAVKD